MLQLIAATNISVFAHFLVTRHLDSSYSTAPFHSCIATNIEQLQKPSPASEDAIQKVREILTKPTPPEKSLVNKEIVVNLENNDEKIQHEAPLPEADGVPLLEAQALQ